LAPAASQFLVHELVRLTFVYAKVGSVTSKPSHLLGILLGSGYRVEAEDEGRWNAIEEKEILGIYHTERKEILDCFIYA
jgi:hypothetical protein